MDINVGDPIWPEPQEVRLPRLLEGELVIRGYPLEMVLAEKIVTALARGTANTRWRDLSISTFWCGATPSTPPHCENRYSAWLSTAA